MKNGFYPSAGWAWRINTVGFIDGPARNQWVVAILTDGWSDDDPGIEATEFVAGAVSYHQIRKSPADHPFIDVPAGAYYEDNAARLFTEGVLSGTSPLFFSPRSPVTRAQLAVMLSSKRSAKLPSSCASRFPISWSHPPRVEDGVSGTPTHRTVCDLSFGHRTRQRPTSCGE